MRKARYLAVIAFGILALAGLWCPATFASEGGAITYRL